MVYAVLSLFTNDLTRKIILVKPSKKMKSSLLYIQYAIFDCTVIFVLQNIEKISGMISTDVLLYPRVFIFDNLYSEIYNSYFNAIVLKNVFNKSSANGTYFGSSVASVLEIMDTSATFFFPISIKSAETPNPSHSLYSVSADTPLTPLSISERNCGDMLTYSHNPSLVIPRYSLCILTLSPICLFKSYTTFTSWQ